VATKEITWPGSIRDLAGESLYAQLYPFGSDGPLINAAEESLAETANGKRAVTADIGSATGWAEIIARYDSDDAFAASGYVNLDEAAPVVNEAVVDVAAALADYDGPTKAEMDAAIAGLAGSGARTVTITVNDGSTALEAANVRVTQGAESYVQSTNASGVATFNLDDATWTVSITKAGYSFPGALLVVSGTTSHTYSMTETIVAPPASPDLSAIEVLCLDETGQPESGVAVDIRIVAVPSGSQNYAFKGTKQTATSDGDGIARFEVVQGSTCEWKRGAADVWKQVVIDSDSLTNVTSVIGSP
jgi:hypothetical protein